MGIKHSASYQSEENMAKNSSGRLADVLVRNLNGEFDETGMELRPEFRKLSPRKTTKSRFMRLR